ncbi:MAG TPA: hypothetical protein PKV17_15610, partial [Aquabacterium sp.]|nr:hypothetical protein [Aquabacterium sp.]
MPNFPLGGLLEPVGKHTGLGRTTRKPKHSHLDTDDLWAPPFNGLEQAGVQTRKIGAHFRVAQTPPGGQTLANRGCDHGFHLGLRQQVGLGGCSTD